MGRQYYCEYCDRTFLDNLTARKKHLASYAHKNNRKAWYDRFRSKRERLNDELAKPRVCRYYAAEGKCVFQNTCRYRHLTEMEERKLREEAEEEEAKAAKTRTLVKCPPIKKSISCSPDEKDQDGCSGKSKSVIETRQARAYELPEVFKSLPYIPPSLRPYDGEQTYGMEMVEWG